MPDGKIVVFGERQVDVFNSVNGEVVQSFNNTDTRKIKFLMRQNDDIVLTTRPQETSKIVLVRSKYAPKPAAANASAGKQPA